MKKILIYLPIAAAIFIYLTVFIFSLYPPQDPDLGWHLKYGQYFFAHHQILRDNTFSYLMPEYHWNNSSWATDLLTYQAFHKLGFIGLSILGAFVVTLTFFFIGKAAKLNLFEKSIIFPMLLLFTSPVNQIAFRGQLISLLFISIMYYLLSIYGNTNKKAILLLLPLFVLWSNFHGEFILGLALFLIWTGVYFLKEMYLSYGKNIKQFVIDEKYLLIAVPGSMISVMINPFGVGVYLESLGHFSNPLQKFVTEFLPVGELSTVWWHQIVVGCLMFLGLLLLGFGKRTLDKSPFYVPSLILFFLAFWIRRYAWPFYYSAIFLISPAVKFLEPEKKKNANYAAFVIAILLLIIAIVYKYPLKEVRNVNWDSYCINTVSCSGSAAKFVIDKKLNNSHLLTIYDYGGYLIWNYPDITPTIDGRMHLWRDENGYSAFEDYYPIERNWRDIDSSMYNAVLTSRQKPIYFHLVKLVRQGKWKVVHVDKLSALFVRNKSQADVGIVNYK